MTNMGEFKLKDGPERSVIRIDFTTEKRRPVYVYVAKVPGVNNRIRVKCDFADEVVLPRHAVWEK